MFLTLKATPTYPGWTMRRLPSHARSSLVLAALALGLASSPVAHAGLFWGLKRGFDCEPPNVFYSSQHRPGEIPCCPTDDGVCPGGAPCPASGVCAGSSTPCVAVTPARPNVVLMISDDQGECFYGSARECRSSETGTPIPAPFTPSRDGIPAGGTVFTVAQNTGSL